MPIESSDLQQWASNQDAPRATMYPQKTNPPTPCPISKLRTISRDLFPRTTTVTRRHYRWLVVPVRGTGPGWRAGDRPTEAEEDVQPCPEEKRADPVDANETLSPVRDGRAQLEVNAAAMVGGGCQPAYKRFRLERSPPRDSGVLFEASTRMRSDGPCRLSTGAHPSSPSKARRCV
eukprot:TRINITY_DN30012_c0_g1_i1.p1 TRINITY_DN30012_c0_g1~~TRINITY_DN30012_c0_g1_i1.p1  ORF type:complete len:176 (+),score=7.12 TRINITY_DN30012_c0_g1_i1:163-690(+)